MHFDILLLALCVCSVWYNSINVIDIVKLTKKIENRRITFPFILGNIEVIADLFNTIRFIDWFQTMNRCVCFLYVLFPPISHLRFQNLHEAIVYKTINSKIPLTRRHWYIVHRNVFIPVTKTKQRVGKQEKLLPTRQKRRNFHLLIFWMFCIRL